MLSLEYPNFSSMVKSKRFKWMAAHSLNEFPFEASNILLSLMGGNFG